ncbi:hypothetical protein BGZ59_009053 [Podila verticillata]|nr:hypothetical protein BGZ59_009053 [Podila verticillata]KAI9236000.1 MAG: hypothetical protein BYD32DRAFT_488424 [Podila humilis]
MQTYRGPCLHLLTQHTQLFPLETMALNRICSVFLVAVLALVVMSQCAEAVTLPAWCTCSDNSSKTQTACGAAGGNWDGGSCGLDQIGKYNAFLGRCSTLGGTFRCWH